jgi:AcrR family transcriptional regulator
MGVFMNKRKKEEILRASEALFNRFGTRKTAVDEIARLANVAKGTIYNYFGNKEGIVKEIIKNRASLFEDLISRSVTSAGDPFKKLSSAINGRIRLIMETPFLADKLLNSNDKNIKQAFEDFDRMTKKTINSILDTLPSINITQFERKRIINTILFTIRGIEDSIRKSIDDISIKNIEKDIDYLINTLFAKYLPAT